MTSFNGKWNYRSFCPRAGTASTPPQIAAPWTPPGVLTVATDATGKVTGTLEFPTTGNVFKVTGSVTPASKEQGLPEGIDLTGECGPAIYKIRGYFIDGSDHITGALVSTQEDLVKRPVGTSGPFILFPVK
jgi:hypothetical protein